MHLHVSIKARRLCQFWLALCAAWPLVSSAAETVQAPSGAWVPEYVSPLRAYQSYAPVDLQNWVQANQTVNDIGGWRAYAREPEPAQMPDHKPAGGRP